MNELITIKVSELKENKEFSRMVPEMSGIEYNEFLKSIEKDGIRQPIHILLDKTILDGRHRVRACKELGINEVQALVHSLDEDEAIAFVRDTAIERRNITVEQRVDIVLKSEELIKSLVTRANENSVSNLKQTKSSTGPMEPIGRTNKVIADMTGSSETTVKRMKRVKRESPESYEEIVKGKETVRGAHDKLPSIKKNKPENPIHDTKKLTEEEVKSKIAYDNLVLNFRQLISYVDNNQENLYEAICKKYENDTEFMEEAKKKITIVLELMKVYKKENNK